MAQNVPGRHPRLHHTTHVSHAFTLKPFEAHHSFCCTSSLSNMTDGSDIVCCLFIRLCFNNCPVTSALWLHSNPLCALSGHRDMLKLALSLLSLNNYVSAIKCYDKTTSSYFNGIFYHYLTHLTSKNLSQNQYFKFSILVSFTL